MKWIKRILGLLLLILIVLLLTSFATNILLPSQSEKADQLSVLDKARIEEFHQLRKTVGAELWPGWSEATIPVVLYNESYAFLTGVENPKSGWKKVPQNYQRGMQWEKVNGEMPYYRQPLPADGTTPEAFTVLISDSIWTASLSTKEWTEISLGNQLKEEIPPVLQPIIPYRLFGSVFNTDWFIAALAHESFHAYQGQILPRRMSDSERLVSQYESSYPWSDSEFADAWNRELATLRNSLSLNDIGSLEDSVTLFLELRRDRREKFNLNVEHIELERQREWLEGLAKYTEIEIWRRASENTNYRPQKALADDSDFDYYRNFGERWRQELNQLERYSGSDSQFYYSGMAQALLLDKLMPGWKERILEDKSTLEGLLKRALSRAKPV